MFEDKEEGVMWLAMFFIFMLTIFFIEIFENNI